jgi:hypothetical protein
MSCKCTQARHRATFYALPDVVRKAADAYIAAAYAEEVKKQEDIKRKLVCFDAYRDETLRRLMSEKIFSGDSLLSSIFGRKRTLDEALTERERLRKVADGSYRSRYSMLDINPFPHLHAAEGLLVALDAAGGAASLQMDTGSPEFAVIRWKHNMDKRAE